MQYGRDIDQNKNCTFQSLCESHCICVHLMFISHQSNSKCDISEVKPTVGVKNCKCTNVIYLSLGDKKASPVTS